MFDVRAVDTLEREVEDDALGERPSCFWPDLLTCCSAQISGRVHRLFEHEMCMIATLVAAFDVGIVFWCRVRAATERERLCSRRSIRHSASQPCDLSRGKTWPLVTPRSIENSSWREP